LNASILSHTNWILLIEMVSLTLDGALPKVLRDKYKQPLGGWVVGLLSVERVQVWYYDLRESVHVKKNTEDPWKMMGLVGTLGFEIVAFIFAGVWLGRFLDKNFGTEPLWLAVCILVGLALGIVSALFTLKTFIKD
jgi:ATP synthase protein I